MDFDGVEENEERGIEVRAVEPLALVRAECFRPAMEDAVVAEPVPLRVVLPFRAGFTERPVAERDATDAAELVLGQKWPGPFVFATMPEDWQVRVNEVTLRFIGRLTRRRSNKEKHRCNENANDPNTRMNPP